jgi:hypothetical protein
MTRKTREETSKEPDDDEVYYEKPDLSGGIEGEDYLLGFDANNKKIIGYTTRIAQDLSISNVVRIN